MDNPFGLPPINKITYPYPAIVIALGNSTLKLTCQVRHIYLRGDARRSKSVTFYQLLPGESDNLSLTELAPEGLSATPTRVTQDYLEQRQAALLSAVKDAPQITNKLKSMLHDQRTHDRLFSIGWGNKYEVPLNIFIIGDIKDAWTAGVLLPLSSILNKALETTRLCQIHLLLNVANFPEHTSDLDVMVWSSLQALDEYLQLDSQPREKLTKALNMQPGQAPDFAVYLFDCRKEGSAVLRDQASLDTHIGNALLALLQEDLASQLSNLRNMNTFYDQRSFYGSLGSTVLIYDPDALQMACAGRTGYIFLEDKILAQPADGQAAIQYAYQFNEKIGGIYSWMKQMCTRLSPLIGQVSIQPDLSEIEPQFTNLNLPPLDYERLNKTPWAAIFREYYDDFYHSTLADVDQQLNSNQVDLKDHLDHELNKALDHLPLEEGLYPGGLQNSRQVLKVLDDGIEKAISDLETIQYSLPDDLATAVTKFTSKCDDLEQLLSSLPKLPWWVRVMPAFIRKWLALILVTAFHGHKLILVNAMQEECVNLLQRLCGLHIKQQALDLLLNIPPHLQAQIDSMKADLDGFENKLIQVRDNFSPTWGTFPLGAAANGSDPLFRQLTTGQELTDWAYAKWMPELNTWVQDFLASEQLFGDWRTVEVKDLAAWVEKQAALAYQPVWSLSLEEVFALWIKETDGFPAEKGLSPETVRHCMQTAIPPARPNFDAVGGSHGAGVTFHFVTGGMEWHYCALPARRSGNERWNVVYGGDPYIAIFVQAYHNFPINALVESFQNAWERLESLSQDQYQAYDMLRALDRPDPSIVESLDPNDPDVIKKVFRWKFQPRGSGDETEQEITLYLSKSRYEYYRRQPRFSGEWNRYAEIEMPEVRMLATEFQKLHTESKWSTFNQAYNVLKFVQACIPYSFDKDSTGHTDWPRYPIETIIEGTGDCEDVAILCAAIIARLGFQVVLLVYPKHIAFGVAGAEKLKGEYVHDLGTGRFYFYGEATADGWHLGQIPKEYREIKPQQIVPVNILIEEESNEV